MIDKTAQVSKLTQIGRNVKIWGLTRIREGVVVGDNTTVGGNVYIDHDVKIGSNVKIEDSALIYHGVTIEDEVFIGPAVCFTNDKYPRATYEGKLKKDRDWQVSETLVARGASIGAGCVIAPGVKIGRYAMIGAGSVVTTSIPDSGLAWGNPAKLHGFVCPNGHPLKIKGNSDKKSHCRRCGKTYKIK